MDETRLIAAMEEEIAARIAEAERQAQEAIRRIEAEAEQALGETERVERARAAEQLLAHQHQQRLRFENVRRARLRDLHFEIAADTLREVEAQLTHARQREDYPAVWQRLFAEALRSYRQERPDAPILQVAPADHGLAEAQGHEVAAIEDRLELLDGVELRSPDGRLHIQNTLLSRLRKGREAFQKMISDSLQEQLAR